MLKTVFKYVKTTFQSSPFLVVLGMIFLLVFRLLQLCMDLSLKFATDSIVSADSVWRVVLPLLLFFISMMLGGNTSNLTNLFSTMYTKKAIENFTKRFMKRAYNEKHDSYYNSDYYNEYEFVKKNIKHTYEVAVTICSRLFSVLVSFIVTAIAITFIDPILLIVILLISVITAAVNIISVKWNSKFEKGYINEERKAEYYGTLVSSKENSKEIRNYSLQNFFLKKWEESYKKYTDARYCLERKTELLQNLPNIIKQIMSSLMILYFLHQTVLGRLEIGNFVLLYRMMWRLEYGIEGIVKVFSHDILENYTYIEQYDHFIELGNKAVNKMNILDQNNVLTEPFEQLELRDVSYSYPVQSGLAVSHVNFNLKRGEIVAILGYNGSGKSTLSKIICGVLEDYQGKVLINGKDSKEMDREKLYPMFGIAFQDFTKYALTVYDNIGVGMVEKISYSGEVSNAVEKCDLTTFIESLPQKINTVLGKEYDSSGIDISGGQWQRLILARAYMGNPPILLFDEPTASIDPIQEMHLLQDFRRHIAGQTAVLISHRIGFARLSDRICVMENGCIVETGSHEDLVKAQGVYASLYEAQKKLYEE